MERKERIMKRLREHYDRGVELYGESRIVGIFLQGSQNYGLDYEGSDIDSKLIIVPSIDDIIFNRRPVSTTHVLENEEHLDAKDIRLYIQTFRKQNLNFLEILFTEFKIVNPQYAKWWDVLVEHREEIARYNEFQAIKSMKGIAMEKYHAMEHPYPSKLAVLAEWGYDPKQVSHLVRIEEYLERYIAGERYEDCLYPNNYNFIMNIKLGKYNLEEARIIAEKSKIHVEELEKIGKEQFLNVGNSDVDILLNNCQKQIMLIAIANELKNIEW